MMARAMIVICVFAYLCTSLEAYMSRAHGPNNKMEGYIVNGQAVSVEKYPFFALITLRGKVSCGGTIISDRLILTAAHCLVMDDEGRSYTPLDLTKVILGASTTKDGTQYDVCKLQVHEKYYKKFNFDIGLMLLAKKIKFGRKVQIATFGTEGWRGKAQRLTVIGFGQTKSSGGTSNKLLMTDMNYITRAQCGKTSGRPKKVPPELFCMHGYDLNDSCYGDSGSPIIWRETVVGLVHAGRITECASPDTPSVYVDVVRFSDWIDDTAAVLLKYASKCQRIGSNKKRVNMKLIIYKS